MLGDRFDVILQKEQVREDVTGEFIRRPVVDDHEDHQRIERRINLERTADPESLYVDRAAGLIFVEEKPGNQETRQQEKQINARPTDFVPQSGIAVDGREVAESRYSEERLGLLD